MMKYYITIVIVTLMASCTPRNGSDDKANVNKVSTPYSLLIKPGKSIGNMQLDSNMEVLTQKIRRPDQSDAAMGSALYTWFVNKDTAGYRISAFGHRNFGGADEAIVHIKKILVTDPRYFTSDGMHAGSPQDSIALFYQLKNSDSYLGDNKNMHLFSDINKGIAFEIDSLNKKCKAIVVFKPGDSPSAYINMY